jgi:hypothetical protein
MHKGPVISARLVLAIGLAGIVIAVVILTARAPQPLHTIVHRFSLGKSDLVRHWAAAATVVLMLLAVGLAIRTILREEGEDQSR